MNLYLLLLELGGAVVLLLWAIRMVRTGVERSHEGRLRRVLGGSSTGRVRAAGIGATVAVVLQSSTAVALLAAGFAGSGALSTTTGLALMLGADFGSALVVRILSVDIDWLIPVLLLAGGGLFFKGRNRQWRQGGRILVGIALVLISLQMMSDATRPLREADLLAGVTGYLSRDVLTAFLVGAAFTWLVHSSIASVLLVATLAAHGTIPLAAGLPLVLGVNFGAGLIALGLTRSAPFSARRIVVGNLLFRAVGATALLSVLAFVRPPMEWLGTSVPQQLINAHLLFNGGLVIVGLPLLASVSRFVDRIVRPPATLGTAQDLLPEAASCLDPAVLKSPNLALASATRELLRMAELVERMLQPLLELYERGDPEQIREARRLEVAVDAAQQQIKLYLAQISYGSETEVRRGSELSRFAINLEYIGDAITRTLLKAAEKRRDRQLAFSPEGWRELGDLHRRVMANMRLALNVLISNDPDLAQTLLREKASMAAAEHESYVRHLERLRSGKRQAVESSNIHLETVRALKTINSLLASVAYPVLRGDGETGVPHVEKA